MLKAAYDLYISPATLSSLDTILLKLKLTHKDFRQYLKDKELAMPELTPGLVEEARATYDDSSIHRRELMDLFNLNFHDYSEVFKPLTTEATDSSRGLDKQAIADICHQRRRGAKVTDIAEHYGVSPGRIYQLTSHIAMQSRKSRNDVKLGMKVEMARKRAKGATIQELSKEYDLSINTVYVYLRHAGSVSV